MAEFLRRRLVLKSLLAQGKTLLIPGCFDCVSAMLAEAAGFPVVYIGSYATSASRLGLPDSGLADYGNARSAMRGSCASLAEWGERSRGK